MRRIAALISGLLLFVLVASGQEKSVKPGINDPFQNPDIAKFAKTFEGESREVFVNRDKVVTACGLKLGMVAVGHEVGGFR